MHKTKSPGTLHLYIIFLIDVLALAYALQTRMSPTLVQETLSWSIHTKTVSTLSNYSVLSFWSMLNIEQGSGHGILV
jgi:hypothetical protein